MTRPMSGGTPRSSTALPQAIRQWREQAVAWVRSEDPDTAALLAKRKQTGIPRVVVIGETNRGKSSMVNALLGVPGLSPVDAGLATCTYLQFSHGSSPTAVAHFAGGMADITFPATELRVWATMDSEPDHDLPPPRWIEVAVPAPLLQTVTVVDTPGVGGLVAGHADLAAEAAAGATALLFVVDASAPFTRGELEFLEKVGDRVDSVHFVVTKTDVFRGWREIVAADQQLLARHVPRFTEAPFHPLSSTLTAAADAQADPRIAEVIREQSGVVNLRRILSEDVAARASLLSDANLIRQAVTVVRGEVLSLDGERRALTNGAERADQLKQRREELLNQRRTGGGRSWQVKMRAEISRARVDLSHETAREVREASQMFRGAIDAADADQLKELPFHIDAYAQAMTSRAHGRLLETMNRIVNAVLVELFTAEELAMLAGTLATRPYAPLATRGPERSRSADDTIMAAAGGGIGFSVGALIKTSAAAVLPGAFGVVLLPVSLALGGAAAFFLVRSRRRVQDRQHLKTWLAEVLGEAKAQIDQNIAEQFIEADEQLTLALDDALTRQVTAIETEIKQVDGALKLDATERAGRLRSLDERRASGVGLVSSGEALLDRIRNTRPANTLMLPGSGTARQIALPPGLPASPPPTPSPPPPPPSTSATSATLATSAMAGQPAAPEPAAQPPNQPLSHQQVPGQQAPGQQMPGQQAPGGQPPGPRPDPQQPAGGSAAPPVFPRPPLDPGATLPPGAWSESFAPTEGRSSGRAMSGSVDEATRHPPTNEFPAPAAAAPSDSPDENTLPPLESAPPVPTWEPPPRAPNSPATPHRRPDAQPAFEAAPLISQVPGRPAAPLTPAPAPLIPAAAALNAVLGRRADGGQDGTIGSTDVPRAASSDDGTAVPSDDEEDVERTRVGPPRNLPPVPFERGPSR